MCGRLCCYCKHSSYSKRLEPLCGAGKQPSWNDSGKFAPSSNLAPTRNILILFLDEHKNLSLRPMVWGLELNSRSKSRTLHNMRIETLLGPYQGGKGLIHSLPGIKKCAIVCDGFFEWSQKRPFFFFNGKNEYDTSIIGPKWTEDDWIEKGPPIMLLAGIYSPSAPQELTGERSYSCAVITRDASSKTRHIHHRNPILLDTEEDIMAWLNCETQTIEQSLRTLISLENSLSCYQVKDHVNNSRYQEHDCHLPLSCFPTSGTLNHWLRKSQTHDTSSADRNPTSTEGSSSTKRKFTSSDSSSKKKSRITDWFKKTPP